MGNTGGASRRCCALLCILIWAATPAAAQNYPIKLIRIIAAEAGSGTEIGARLIAQGISAAMGQQVIVDNRGPLAGELTARAPADGYTILAYGSPLWLAPFIHENTAYDPLRDFAPITLAATSPNILVVHPSLRISTIKQLIALATARPSDLNYGSGSAGSSTQIAAELFKSMAGVDIVRVPYKGSGPALNALIGGQVQVMFPSAGSVASYVKLGRLVALAVTTTAAASALAPGLPTVAAAGLPGYESASPLGIFVPARTRAAVINRLNMEIVRVLNNPDVKERFFRLGYDTVGSAPEQLATAVKLEMSRAAKILK